MLLLYLCILLCVFFYFKNLILIITQTRLCIILQYFTAVKTIILRLKIVIFLLLLLKTYIVGTR